MIRGWYVVPGVPCLSPDGHQTQGLMEAHLIWGEGDRDVQRGLGPHGDAHGALEEEAEGGFVPDAIAVQASRRLVSEFSVVWKEKIETDRTLTSQYDIDKILNR